MKQRKPIPRKRDRPRRRRPELFAWTKTDKVLAWQQQSRELRRKWWANWTPEFCCGICHRTIWSFYDLVPDHIVPGKMGGCKDHRPENLQPAHWWCNSQKGSKRLSA